MKTTGTGQRRPTPDRSNDKLLTFDEIAARRRQSPAQLRWLRHRGELGFVFKLNGRLVGWQSDCDADIEAQAAKDAESRAS